LLARVVTVAIAPALAAGTVNVPRENRWGAPCRPSWHAR